MLTEQQEQGKQQLKHDTTLLLQHRQKAKYPTIVVLFSQRSVFPSYSSSTWLLCPVILYVKVGRDTPAIFTDFQARNECESQGQAELPLESISLK